MKRLILSLFAILFFAPFVSAQLRDLTALSVDDVRKPLLGVRIGWAPTMEFSYQVPVKIDNRMEYGFEYDPGVLEDKSYRKVPSFIANFRGVYQWIRRDIRMASGFYYYFGPGVGLVFQEMAVGVGLLGQIGLEYRFADVPFCLSLDYRPGVYYNDPKMFKYNNTPAMVIYDDFRLGVRYAF